ncbi:MAG: sigma-54-dependent transcriptional regulator [bacterium]
MSDGPRRRVLIVDDERNILSSLAGVLGDEGFDTRTAATGEDALETLRAEAFDLAILDVRLPDTDGVSLLEKARALRPDLPVVMMSGNASIDIAVRAVRLGAFDFLEKPLSPDRLIVVVRNATERARLVAENRRLREEAPAEAILGESEAIRALRDAIAQIAPTRGRVLILGESGTGKELVAKALHDASPRANAPFIKMNCAAIPPDLIESTLFGHERGAFTGATTTSPGKFEQAHLGTLLLDEVGDMSLETQAKLLRVLEAGEIERVGGRRTIPVDVRVLSATNKSPLDEIAGGRFREDLYFRLAVVPLMVPPLRDRGADIILLAEHFLARFAAEYGRVAPRLEREARDALLAHAWPGNVRELRNAMERAVILLAGANPATIRSEDARRLLHASDGASAPASRRAENAPRAAQPEMVDATRRPERSTGDGLSLAEQIDRLERDLISEALHRLRGNVAEASRELGIDRANLHRKMRRLGITREGASPAAGDETA